MNDRGTAASLRENLVINLRHEGLTRDKLVEVYRLMLLSRRLDDREIVLKRQQKVFFQLAGAGHEAFLVAAALNLRPGYDWFYPYYRDRALCLTLGMTPLEQLLGAVGSADDPSSGGRQMPSHWGHQKLNIVSQSSPVGTQFLQAVGCAEAGQYFAFYPAATRSKGHRGFRKALHHPDEVVYVSTGEGTTSQGEFWESLNTASNKKLPLLYVIEDNEYAISVPVEVQTAGGNISRLVAGFPDFHLEEVDGTNFVESFGAFQRAVEYVRARRGPALVHGHVIRPYSHSLSDDERLYRPESERKSDADRDPIRKFRALLIQDQILDEIDIRKLESSVETEVSQAADMALDARTPTSESWVQFIYSPDFDPTCPEFETLPDGDVIQQDSRGSDRTMADLINSCLRDEMRHDARIVIFGQDVADCSREEHLIEAKVKGKGGVFKLTAGLQAEFGSRRVFNAPLAEANIVGRAVGMATRGLKPIVEIQFFDYIWPAMQQLRNELPLIRWRSNNAFSCPAVVRAAIGGYVTGGGIYHSQSGECIFTHTPGMHVVFPSNALDAAGLLRTAIRCDDPVLFLEHKRLYRETYERSAYPGPNYMIPFGKAKTVQVGEDLTIVTYGATVPRALQAARRLERDHSIKAELIDLRTLNPYDWPAIAGSVLKTSRVIVVHEDMLSWGYGAEIAARIGRELFMDLDAPVYRLGARDVFVGYQPVLEDAVLPRVDDILAALLELAKF